MADLQEVVNTIYRKGSDFHYLEVEFLNVGQIASLMDGTKSTGDTGAGDPWRGERPTAGLKVHYVVFRSDNTESKKQSSIYYIGASIDRWSSQFNHLPWSMMLPVVVDRAGVLDEHGKLKPVEKPAPTYAGKVVEIDGKKYKLQEV